MSESKLKVLWELENPPWTSFKLLEAPFTYTGRELRPHFLYEKMGVRGSGVVCFLGPCDVPTDHLVDWEDRVEMDSIRAKEMMHFIGEFFGWTLREGVLLQRLFMASFRAALSAAGHSVVREGDDLYFVTGGRRGKLSVSIVTVSPVSILFHAAINCDKNGVPAHVEAADLKDLGLNRSQMLKMAQNQLEWLSREWPSVEWACTKVRPVME